MGRSRSLGAGFAGSTEVWETCRDCEMKVVGLGEGGKVLVYRIEVLLKVWAGFKKRDSFIGRRVCLETT